jgi:alpha-galactosidase
MKKQALFIALGVVIAASLAAAPAAQAADTAKTVKVFLLAGQSNMQGMFFTPDMEKQAEDPKYKDLYKNLRKDGKWIVRDDVFLKQGKRLSPLTRFRGHGSGDTIPNY